jgi:hypothetical protein
MGLATKYYMDLLQFWNPFRVFEGEGVSQWTLTSFFFSFF